MGSLRGTTEKEHGREQTAGGGRERERERAREGERERERQREMERERGERELFPVRGLGSTLCFAHS
jgi:hypothetical protein